MKRLIPALTFATVALAASWVGPWPEDELRLAQARQARQVAGLLAELRQIEDQVGQIGAVQVTATVTLAVYHPVPAQTSPTPWVTASGRPSRPGVTCAVSRPLRERLGLRWGDQVVIPGRGVRVVEDLMAARIQHDALDLMEPVGTPAYLEEARVVFLRGE
ncbi:MAG: hypothetical protein HY794_13465 [Desulfarculus sp.]|nr:hypothetical protein [Desulfarculus sp.]